MMEHTAQHWLRGWTASCGSTVNRQRRCSSTVGQKPSVNLSSMDQLGSGTRSSGSTASPLMRTHNPGNHGATSTTVWHPEFHKISPAAPNDPSDQVDPGPQVVEEWLGLALRKRVHAAELRALKRFFKQCQEQQPVGSVCSGTECPVLMCAKLSKMCRRHGIPMDLLHSYSVELNPKKRVFLMKMMPCSHAPLFGNLLNLKYGVCRNMRLPSGSDKIPVPGCFIFYGGFPCADVSSYNMHSSGIDNTSCVSLGSLRTGSCFNAIIDHLTAEEPKAKPMIRPALSLRKAPS